MISEKISPQTLFLIATNDYGATHRYELKNGQGVFIGKSSNCGLQLHDNKINDIHCRIGMEDGKLQLQNWMSAEGTLVNGREIDSEQEIGLHDVVQVGSHKIRVSTSNSGSNRLGDKDATPEAVEPNRESVRSGRQDHLRHPETNMSECETDSLLESPTAELLKPPSNVESPTRSSEDVLSTFDLAADEEFELQLQIDTESMDADADFFCLEEDMETFDRETVALLQAEIEDLRAALAQRDADQMSDPHMEDHELELSSETEPDEVLHRMEELIEEANRSDERAAVLEEMLHAAEDANRSEREERTQLEAWVRDIEHRIGTREEEHAAEIDALKNRLKESSDQQERLQKQLRQLASGPTATANKQYEEVLDNLQRRNRELQEELSESQKRCLSLEKRLESSESGQDDLLRAERAKLAQEQAKVSRLRYELSSKLAEIEQLPKSSNRADQETGERIRALREHLREIHEQEKHEVKETTLATRLAKLWKRVEY